MNVLIDRLNTTEEISTWKIKLKKYYRTQHGKTEEENMKNMSREMEEKVRRSNTYLIRVSKVWTGDNEEEATFKEVTDGNFSKLMERHEPLDS